ncbi:MAG: hypothetical protein GKR90_26805 [Pseudomonadales bacterium]|nr:hypothetical protein [Pseudomonadales bacterium]
MNDKSKFPRFIYPIEEGERLASKPDALFIGRRNLLINLVKAIENSRQKRGSFLIAGYRGVGKTALVDNALWQVAQNNDNHLIRCQVNLGIEASLSNRDVLSDMTESLATSYDDHYRKVSKKLLLVLGLCLLFLSLLLYEDGYRWFHALGMGFIPKITVLESLNELGSSVAFWLILIIVYSLGFAGRSPGLLNEFTKKLHDIHVAWRGRGDMYAFDLVGLLGLKILRAFFKEPNARL